MKKRKCILLLLSLLFIKNIYADENNKIEWKEMNLSVDINKDNVKDVVKVQYYENNDKVIVKFTPTITNGKKYETIDKIFDRDTFGTEFYPFVNNLIQEYSKKEEISIEKNDQTKNLKDPYVNIKNEKNITEVKQAKINTSKLIKGPYNYKEYYLKDRPDNLTFNYKYQKNSPIDMDEFIFIKTTVSIRQEPKMNSKVLKTATYTNKYKVVGKITVAGTKGNTDWYEIYFDGKLGYIPANSNIAIKRTFDWHDMISKIEKTNKFIKEAIDNNQKIYVLDDYTPLGGGSGQFKDKFGNRENQSEKGYLTPEMKEFINIPDRSLMTILDETDKYIKVKIDFYNGVFYINKNVKKLLKDSEIKSVVTRFIYIDRSSQNEMIVEKNENSNTWNVVTSSFVTTGKDSEISYATPYGAFLIAYSKPVMQYTSDKDHTKIVGDAKNAIRFSGGGYMHSIPAVFEPKATINQRKAITASRIGTYAESHKCVRHYDDQIKFIYDWIGNSTPGHKYGYRTPIVPTIMLVK